MTRNIRYALLAGAMMPMAMAAPQSGMAEGGPGVRPAERAIILAQAVVNPNDPKEKAKTQTPAPPPKPGIVQPSGQPPTNLRSVTPSTGNNQPANTQQKIIQQTNTPQNNQLPANTQQKIIQQTNTPQNQQINTGTPPGKPALAPTGTGTTRSTTTTTTTTTTIRGTQGTQGTQGTPGQRVINAPATGAKTVQPGTITNVNQLQSVRVVKQEPNGRVTIHEPGRLIIKDQGRTFIVRDDMQRFRSGGTNFKTEKRGNENFAFINRPGGYRIVNVTGPDGRLIRRSRIGRDGHESVIFRNVLIGGVVATGVVLALAAPAILIPRHHYVVDVGTAPPVLLYETLDAPPVAEIDRDYSLEEILQNVNLRAYVRSLDLDSITFDTGSWQIAPEQYPKLEAVAEAMKQVLARHPNSVFLIEGHTDLIGNDVDNLALSDERANAVAVVLTDAFQIPPENLVTRGYGEQFPKINDPGPIRENRRVKILNITRLLARS